MRHHRLRQERWLHTRISGDLQEALKREARRRRTPVSLLVRNVLEGALDLVEDIVEDSLAIARRSRGLGGSAPRAEELSDVYGWQELILNRGAVCGRCETALASGAEAHRGLRDRPGPPVFLCATCIGRLRTPAAHRKENAS